MAVHPADHTAQQLEREQAQRQTARDHEHEHEHHASQTEEPTTHSPHDVMGHGGHAGMSMDDMVRDMRNRFLVAAIFSVPIMLWSPIGRDMLGFDVAGAVRAARRRVGAAAQPAGRSSTRAWIFFDGAVPGAAGPHPRHDGAGRGRRRRRLALLASASP